MNRTFVEKMLFVDVERSLSGTSKCRDLVSIIHNLFISPS
jgi:hypothetical protein